MAPPPSPGVGADPTQGAAPVDRVLVRVNEAAPAKPEIAKKPDEKSGKALEWTKAIGMPLVTLVATVVGGYYLTNLTKEREARESDERLYAQLLTQREQSDALIRKDMFGVVINRFLADAKQEDRSGKVIADFKQEDWNNKVLQLELLASNFNQSLDLAPLFKDLARRLSQATGLDPAQTAELKQRLDRTAADVLFRQVNSLARRGFAKEEIFPLAGWETRFGEPFIVETIPKRRLVPETPDAPVGKEEQLRFEVEVIGVAIDRREVEIRLRAYFYSKDHEDLDRHFWVGLYDFPMLDNTQLPYGLRTSVVITEFGVPDEPVNREANSFVKFHLVVFPAASASYKERQDYDDILIDMLRAKGKRIGREGEQP